MTAWAADLERAARILDALKADIPTVIPALDQARDNGHRSGWPTGQPGGRGGHTDLSDRLRYTPEVRDADGNVVSGGDLIGSDDPADMALVELGRHKQTLMQSLVGLRRIVERTLQEPTPTGLCRHGACPAGNPATSIVGGMPRCSACKRFWYSTSNPAERVERDRVGQPTPLPRGERVVA